MSSLDAELQPHKAVVLARPSTQAACPKVSGVIRKFVLGEERRDL